MRIYTGRPGNVGRLVDRGLLIGCVASLLAACGGTGGSGDGRVATAPPARKLEPLTSTSLAGVVNGVVTPTPTVRLTNQAGEPIAGVGVSFLAAGGGNVAGATVVTGADGIATAGEWRMGSTTGTHTLTARASGIPDVVFTAVARPGPVARLVQLGGGGAVPEPGATLPDPLRVRVVDSFANPVPGVRVTFNVISGGGAVADPVMDSDPQGVATSGLWTLGPAGGTQQVRAEGGGASTVFSVLPCDATCRQSQLAFVRDGSIFTLQLQTGEQRRLTNDGNRDLHPAWSPDGSRIAFARDATRNGQTVLAGAVLYVMNADGSQLLRRADGVHSPSWSPDGRMLAVASGDCIYDCDIYLLAALDTASSATLFVRMGGFPAWSPDGGRIAYVQMSGDDGYHELRVRNVDGTGDRVIVPLAPHGIYNPAWSPDGSRIAAQICDGACDIHVVDADGSAIVRLTSVGIAGWPAWSPDGTRVAFTLWPRGATAAGTSLAYVAADGAGTPVTITGPGYDATWRPTVPAGP